MGCKLPFSFLPLRHCFFLFFFVTETDKSYRSAATSPYRLRRLPTPQTPISAVIPSPLAAGTFQFNNTPGLILSFPSSQAGFKLFSLSPPKI